MALAALLAHAPGAVLVGEKRQALLREEDGAGTYNVAFSWIERRKLTHHLPSGKFPYRCHRHAVVGRNRRFVDGCEAHSSAPDTKLLPVLFEPIQDAAFLPMRRIARVGSCCGIKKYLLSKSDSCHVIFIVFFNNFTLLKSHHLVKRSPWPLPTHQLLYVQTVSCMSVVCFLAYIVKNH